MRAKQDRQLVQGNRRDRSACRCTHSLEQDRPRTARRARADAAENLVLLHANGESGQSPPEEPLRLDASGRKTLSSTRQVIRTLRRKQRALPTHLFRIIPARDCVRPQRRVRASGRQVQSATLTACDGWDQLRVPNKHRLR